MAKEQSVKHRITWLDELRGIAVVLMIHTHALSSWLTESARSGAGYAVYQVVFAVPSRLFLVLFGVSHVLSGRKSARPVRASLVRAAELFAFAMLLRLWDWGSRGGVDPVRLFKVDILNAMALSAVALSPLALTRKPAKLATAAVALVVLVVVAASFGASIDPPSLVPLPLAAYLSGSRPLAHFPLAPWLAYAAAGAAIGAAASEFRNRRTLVRVALGSSAVALGLWWWRRGSEVDGVLLARESDPRLVLLGIAGVVALSASWAAARQGGSGEGRVTRVLTMLGRASLPIYFVHLGICFGPLSRPWHGQLTLVAAVAGAWGVVGAMALLAAAHLRFAPRRRLSSALRSVRTGRAT